jgi:hypothetical protein
MHAAQASTQYNTRGGTARGSSWGGGDNANHGDRETTRGSAHNTIHGSAHDVVYDAMCDTTRDATRDTTCGITYTFEFAYNRLMAPSTTVTVARSKQYIAAQVIIDTQSESALRSELEQLRQMLNVVMPAVAAPRGARDAQVHISVNQRQLDNHVHLICAFIKSLGLLTENDPDDHADAGSGDDLVDDCVDDRADKRTDDHIHEHTYDHTYDHTDNSMTVEPPARVEPRCNHRARTTHIANTARTTHTTHTSRESARAVSFAPDVSVIDIAPTISRTTVNSAPMPKFSLGLMPVSGSALGSSLGTASGLTDAIINVIVNQVRESPNHPVLSMATPQLARKLRNFINNITHGSLQVNDIEMLCHRVVGA